MTVSKAAIEGAKLARQSGKRDETRIKDCPGLYVISQPPNKQGSVNQSWAYRYRSPVTHKPAKLTLGPLSLTVGGIDVNVPQPLVEPVFGEPLDLDGAKELAQVCRKMLKQRIDPAIAVKELKDGTAGIVQAAKVDGWTFEELLTKFMQWYQPNRDTTKIQTAYWLGLKSDGKGGWLPRGVGKGVLGTWRGRVFSRHDGAPVLTKVDANDVLSGMPKVSRNRTRSALKIFSGWASEHGANGTPYVTMDPFAGLKRKTQDQENPDRHVLKPWEIAALWKAVMADPDPYGLGALLILITAQRPEMTFDARFGQFDFVEREWHIKAADVKVESMGDHMVPLSERALWLIAQLPTTSGYLFQPSGNEKRPLNRHWRPKDKLDAKANRVAHAAGKPSLDHWTYKDLQRTAITMMEEVLHVPSHVTKAIQQHAIGSKSDQAYRTGSYAEQRAGALERWGQYLAEITA
ncbi:hypothetical protein [Ensifer sp. Root278]|uniref:tyrosine-type recombinase/integrase n=1 Tax=Ensifer sp. Root278 TaxID=1736509 RepID=UPI000710CD00|nr:hypothetical protein [Ensifer sp. Root278]KRD71806.1 hypothetical protein ASE60_24725 [Ensifer sp. Root278]